MLRITCFFSTQNAFHWARWYSAEKNIQTLVKNLWAGGPGAGGSGFGGPWAVTLEPGWHSGWRGDIGMKTRELLTSTSPSWVVEMCVGLTQWVRCDYGFFNKLRQSAAIFISVKFLWNWHRRVFRGEMRRLHEPGASRPPPPLPRCTGSQHSNNKDAENWRYIYIYIYIYICSILGM